MRLQKVLADRGVASRRKSEELIALGRVSVDGKVERRLGTQVTETAWIEVDGRPVAGALSRRYVLLNKPRGVLATARDERGRPTVTALVGAPERLYPVGRLDADSEGLLLLTNDGAWAQRVLHPRFGHEREYEVSLRGVVSAGALARLRRGVRLEEGVARAATVRLLRRDARGATVRLVLRTGWKRQVRRMCAAVGLRVLALERVRLGPLVLGRLRTGAWRELTPREVRSFGGND